MFNFSIHLLTFHNLKKIDFSNISVQVKNPEYQNETFHVISKDIEVGDRILYIHTDRCHFTTIDLSSIVAFLVHDSSK